MALLMSICSLYQFVVSPLLITRCAEECPKGPHVGFPETKLLGIPFFPGINIKISCTVVIMVLESLYLGLCAGCLGMFQLSGSFTALFRCPKTMIKTHSD